MAVHVGATCPHTLLAIVTDMPNGHSAVATDAAGNKSSDYGDIKITVKSSNEGK